MAGSVEIGSGASSGGRGKKLLDRALDALWNAGFDSANATRYVSWMRQYILFHDKRHPQQMGMPEVDAFLASEAFAGPAGTANRAEARRALQFLYEEVLHRRWPRRTSSAAAQRRKAKKAVYLNGQQKDVKLLDRMRNAMRVGQYALQTENAYVEWARRYICRTRVKDVDLDRLQLVVRDGKGNRDRVTVLPQRLVEPLRRQIDQVRQLHEDDLARGFGTVWLPPALRRKYPNAERELGWQYLFPSKKLSVDPRERGKRTRRRHHLHVSSLENAVKAAVRRSGLTKQITPHTFRHSFATRLLETNHNIRQVQELLGHKDIQTTMIYLHVMEGGTTDVRSPLDTLGS